jgi:hypothetical protein
MGVPTGAVGAFTRGVMLGLRGHPWETALIVLVLIVLCVVINSLQHMGCIKEETQEGDASPV